jgi:hypothetical protein
MLAEELAAQRTFLSAEEAAALERPVSYENEDDLAWDRIRGRRTWFFSALRDRFIRDGREVGRWRELIVREEIDAGGEPTFVSQLARQVMQWAVRTSDRSAMLAGFAAKASRVLGLLLALLGGWAYFNGAPAPGAVVGGVGLLAVGAGSAFGAVAARRVRQLSAPNLAPAREKAQSAAGT